MGVGAVLTELGQAQRGFGVKLQTLPLTMRCQGDAGVGHADWPLGCHKGFLPGLQWSRGGPGDSGSSEGVGAQVKKG